MTASFAERVEQYIAMRRGLGHRLTRQATYLRSFAAFLDRCGHDGPVPVALSVKWATDTRSHDPHNPARRLSAVGGFLRYLAPPHRLGGPEPEPTGGLGAGGGRQWIAHARLLFPHLTRSRRALLPDAHHHSS